MSFDRGVFSSTERYRVKFTEPAADGQPPRNTPSSSSSTWTMAPSLSNLKSGSFCAGHGGQPLPAGRNAPVKEWFAATKGATPLSGAYSVSYAKNVSGTFDMAPVEFAKGDTSLKFSGMKGDVTYATGTKHGTVALQADSLVMAGPSEESDIVRMAMQGLTLTSDMTPAKNEMYVGSQKLALKNWTITSKEKPPVQLKDTVIAVDMTEANSPWA